MFVIRLLCLNHTGQYVSCPIRFKLAKWLETFISWADVRILRFVLFPIDGTYPDRYHYLSRPPCTSKTLSEGQTSLLQEALRRNPAPMLYWNTPGHRGSTSYRCSAFLDRIEDPPTRRLQIRYLWILALFVLPAFSNIELWASRHHAMATSKLLAPKATSILFHIN